MRAVLAGQQTDLTVLMENVHKAHNMSAILRSCDAVGVFEVHATKNQRKARSHRRASASATTYVDVRTHASIERAIAYLHEHEFRIYAAHQSPSAVDFRSIDYTKPTAILLGQELDGVTKEAAALVDGHIAIPMVGMVASLNVSVACALTLFEAQRQRQNASMYKADGRTPLSDERLFEWMYPRVAAALRRDGTPYPSLDERGDIVVPHEGALPE